MSLLWHGLQLSPGYGALKNWTRILRAGSTPAAILMLVIALVVGAPTWRVLIISLLSSSSYFPNFPYWPLWLPLGSLVFGFLLYFLLQVARKCSVKPEYKVVAFYLLALVLVVACLGDRSATGAVGRPLADEPTPRLLMARSAERLKAAVDRHMGEADRHGYPTDPEILEDRLREGKHLPSSGYRSHGLAKPVRVVVVCGADGPVLKVRPGDGAGTIYYAVNESKNHYWITMVGLSELPAGVPRIMRAVGNQPAILQPESTVSGENE